MTTKFNTTESMNASQQAVFHKFVSKAVCNGRYEVKKLEVTSFDDGEDVMVYIVTGRPNDEGTMAELICRDTYRFFIGKRGGLFRYGNRGGVTPIRFSVDAYFTARDEF